MLPSFDLHAKKLKILINSFPEFLFSIYWWTWKTNNSLKNCWSGPIKNNIILKFTMLYFFKKIKKNTCKYHYKNLDDIIHSSWDVEQNILKLVILVHFLPFYPQKPLKSKFWKMEISFYTCEPKITIMYDSWDTEWDRQNFLSFWVIFCPFNNTLPPPFPHTTLTILKIKILILIL